MKMILLTIILCFSTASYAGEYFLSYGLGILNSADYSAAQVKMANLGFRSYFLPGFYWDAKAGFWADNSPGYDRKSSGYASAGLGMKVNLEPMEIRAGWGLAAITTPDSYLGGSFPQFNGELYMGWRDPLGHGIGLQYEHISSSGLEMPNRGRDFLLLQLSMKLPLFGE